MGKGSRVDEDVVDALVARIVNAFYQFVFRVALHVEQVMTPRSCQFFEASVNTL